MLLLGFYSLLNYTTVRAEHIRSIVIDGAHSEKTRILRERLNILDSFRVLFRPIVVTFI